jgi:TonB-dependent SusC/RagA subfamily outer membrane receptor
MRLLSLKLSACFILLTNVFICNNGFSQDRADSNQTQISQIESQINEKLFLLKNQQQLNTIKYAALKTHNDILFGRTLYDLLQVRDQRTEDTLYFRNSAFLDTLIADKTTSPKLKAILYIMRAQRISKFDNRYLRFNYAAYRSKSLNTDYASLSPQQRDSLVAKDLDAAFKLGKMGRDGRQLLWLSSNPDVFLFDPAFEDLVLSERVNLLALKRYFNEEQRIAFGDWLSLPSALFRQKLDSLGNDGNNKNDILTDYNRWLTFHKSDPEVSSFIESLIRKYIYLPSAADSVVRRSYVNYLEKSIDSPYPALKAHAVYQLCLIWNENGNNYAYFGNGYSFEPQNHFNPQYQFYPAKALQLYQQHKDLIEKYPPFNKVLSLMAQQIQSKGLSIEMEDKLLPEKEIAIRAIYRNTDTLFYRIIKTGATEAREKNKMQATAGLLNKPTVAQGLFALPLPPDHNNHAVYLKLPVLPVGHYRLLFSDMPFKVSGNDLSNLNFEVTTIAAINTDQRIFVLNRKTGFPLTGARVKAFKQKKAVTSAIQEVVRNEGYIKISDDLADSISITYKGDTTGYKFSVSNNKLRDEFYNKADYDDLVEFYDDKLHMQIFTDRSIYRPGQTVHYKIIFLTNDADTGNPILFNKENLGGEILNKILKKWLSDAYDKITLRDPFNKKIDSASLKINDFGSFAGSFTIPKTAATGNWSIDGKPHIDYQNRGEFRVEEYKRPTIELSMEKQQKMLLPGQPFTIKLKLRSFSGADLGNIPVQYTINRGGRVPAAKTSRSSYYNDYRDTTLIKQTGHTDNKGELSILVSDTVLAKTHLSDSIAWNYAYHITATAVDATGESTDLSEGISVSSWPVKISIPVQKTYDRRAFPVLNISTSADNEGIFGRKVNIKLYRIDYAHQHKDHSDNVDLWYYNKSDWNTWFPDKADLPELKEVKTLVLDTVINTANHEKLTLPGVKLKAAFYQLIATVKENGKTTGESKYSFDVFDSKSGESPIDNINYLPVNTAAGGDMLTWYNSNKTNQYVIYHVLYVAKKKKKAIVNFYQTCTEKAGIQQWNYKVPANAIGYLVINRITVTDNKINRQEKQVYINTDMVQPPDIIVEKYRKVMAPGAKETFTLSVKTKNDNVAAELMTTLYDASLDKLEQHRWNLPNTTAQPYYFNTHWNYSITSNLRAGDYKELFGRVVMREIQARPGERFLNGKVAGLNITDAHGLNEVAVVGYGSVAKRELTYSVVNVMVRGVSSLRDYEQPLIVIDGEVFTGDFKNINASLITQIMVLKGADASALYGSRAAQGVLIISTKGPIVLPTPEEPVVKVRKNFNETAFFYPQLHVDKDGYYRFSFTMPETATEWNWKILAHTRKAQFAYLEKKLQTQLNLMVQPNMPRLLYQSDQIKLQSRISNLDTLAIQGRATWKIEDAVTGEDITSIITDHNSQPFSLDRKSSGAVSFLLHVPTAQIHPLKIVITATGGSAADAEEHTIPVLSSRVFVRQSQPLHFQDQPAVTITPVKLPVDASLYGVGISIAQKPQASLINALPWLANYSFDCAEQTFNKLRAQVTTLSLMRRDTAAQKEFKKAASFIEKDRAKEDILPDELAEAAIPWLGLTNKTQQQQKQLFHLLDTSVNKININKHLERLYKLQQPDGGLTWFEGGKGNPYISAYVLAGFGQLKQMGWFPDPMHEVRQQEFINRLCKYQEDLLVNAPKDNYYNMFELYALSYWLKENPLPSELLNKITFELNTEWALINSNSLAQQALTVINTLRYTAHSDPLNTKAQQQLENIRQMAIQDSGNGLRWKDLADAEELNNSAEETIALLAEAFELSGKYKDVQRGILKWLLTTKQNEHWQTTKATAAAVNMLQKQKGSTLGETKEIATEIEGAKLSVSDGLLDGTSAAFAPIKNIPPAVTLVQKGNNSSGALTWYYFAEPVTLDTLNKAVKVNKQFYSYDNDRGWIKLTPGTVLKAGDRIQVKLTVETSSRLKFVQITDPRAAAFEPKDTNSGYRYSSDFGYYQSVRDNGLDIFAESIPKGISVVTYELVVAHEGEFTSGPAKLQCMYQPAITAYSSTTRINSK